MAWPWNLGYGVVQGHWKLRHSIDHVRLAKLQSVCHCNYSSILYRFSHLTLNNITTLTFGLEVTQDHWKRYHSKAWYSFLFVFHSNYNSILYHFRDKARYWPKIAIFSYPSCIRRYYESFIIPIKLLNNGDFRLLEVDNRQSTYCTNKQVLSCIRGSPSKYCHIVWRRKSEKLDLCGCPTAQKFDDTFCHFDRDPACDRQMDRHVHRHLAL